MTPDVRKVPLLRYIDNFSTVVAYETRTDKAVAAKPIHFGQMTVGLKSLTAKFTLFDRPAKEKTIFYQEWIYKLTSSSQIMFAYKLRGDNIERVGAGTRNAFIQFSNKLLGGTLYLKLGEDGLDRDIPRSGLPEEDWGKLWERFVEAANGSNTTQRTYGIEFRINF